jgi:dipeptidyl aminopeptidase/acylaminoacyl peptidase
MGTFTLYIFKLGKGCPMKRTLLSIFIFLAACSANESTPVSYFDVTTPLAASPQPDVAVLTASADPNQPKSLPTVTETSPSEKTDDGELFFFLQPREAKTAPIRLARVSGACVVDSSNCPPMQIVAVPFAFNFTINALSWSPDGKYAAFSYSDQPNGTPTKLWLFDATANTWTSLAEFPYIDPPFWSPDGMWIAFRAQDGLGGENVYLVHPDGSGIKHISAGLPLEGRPYIMDGWYKENVIMHSALPGRESMIYLLQAGDGTARPMFEALSMKAKFVAAPDASLLVYDDYDPANRSHVLRVTDPGGGNAVSLAKFTDGSLYPIVWSPNSQWVAFNYYSSFTNGSPGAEVYVVRRDGSSLLPIYKGTTVGRLAFSPNGRYLLVEETTSITGGHLFFVNLSTLEARILQAPGLSIDYDWYAPSWRP